MNDNWRRVLMLMLALLALSWPAGCGAASPAVTASNERFALRLSSTVGMAQPTSNVAVSPLLVQAALTLMIAPIPSGKAREIQQGLELLPLGSPKDAERGLQDLVAAVKQKAAVGCQLKLLSVFYNSYSLTNDFRMQASKMGVETVVLNSESVPKVVEQINYDFQQRSNFSLGEVLSSQLLPEDFEAPAWLFISALAFRSRWAQAFDPAETQQLKFYSDADNYKLVDAMVATHRYKYGELAQLDARIIELPLERAGLSLTIVYPNELTGLAALERQLKDYDMELLRRQLSETKVTLTLPKFTLATHHDLKQPLSELGLSKLFFKRDLGLTVATQSALLELDESGGDAGDAFSFGDLFRKAVPMVINHPFYFVISNELMVLLAGHIVDI